MRIAIHARTKHPDLWPAAQKLGSVAALAIELGQHKAAVYKWVTLKGYPKELRSEVADQLRFLTGKSLEELWPEELRAAIEGEEAAKEITKIAEVSRLELAERYAERMMLPAPDEVVEEAEFQAHQIETAFSVLRPREIKLVKMHYGIGCEAKTLAEIGSALNISKERVRQLLTRALSKIRDEMND